VRIDFAPDPSLYPFKPHWFESYAGQLHYVDEGAGPPILFCHGNPTWSFLYRKVITRLRGRFRCIAVDYLGFGLSERRHPRQYVVLARRPQDDGVQQGGGHVMGAAAAAGAQHLRRLDRAAGMAHHLTHDEMDHYRKVQPSPDARRGVAELPRQLLAARPLLERLSRDVPATLGAKPALLLWGMKDLAFRPAHLLPRMQAAFASSVTVELPRARHYIQEDAPEEIAQAITSRFA
jgi:haloalkane dehalogenase